MTFAAHLGSRTSRRTALGILALITAPSVGAQPTADSAARRRIQPLPAVGSSPESGLQLGVTVLGVWTQPADRNARPAIVQASVLRSFKAQTRLSLDAERWSPGNARRLATNLVYQQFPLPYFGLGDTASAAAEEIYTPRGVELGASVQQRVRGAWYATLGARYIDQRITPDTLGTLRSGVLPGASGARVSEVIVGAIADSRDHILAPSSGTLLTLNVTRAARGALSDLGYTRWRLDARRYHAMSGDHVLAGQLLVLGVQGSAPFDQLALVGGGDIMRGYTRGRYRDRWMLAAQTEYRSPMRRRLGAVVFAGAGVVGPTADALFTDRVVLPSYGVGARFQLDARQRSAVRVDYGRGRDAASGLYIGFNQAF
jgi:outer membrane protein assembly factor BamA